MTARTPFVLYCAPNLLSTSVRKSSCGQAAGIGKRRAPHAIASDCAQVLHEVFEDIAQMGDVNLFYQGQYVKPVPATALTHNDSRH